MPEKLKSSLARVFGAVRDFTIAQRTLALLALAILVVAVVALVAWMSRPSYAPLFSGMSGADAAAVVDQLESQGVPYELSDGGATVLVPEEQVYSQRLAAASAGLPADEPTGGYSLLDDMGVTASEFQQDVTYKRALEGELARTVSALEGVETASVQLSIPEDTVFAEEKGTPTASVFLAPERGATFSNDQVEAVVHLVSASIDGMAPTDVAVVDANGEVLSEVGAGTRAGDRESGEYEQRVSAQVQAMLDKLVGPGASTVAVTAQMDRSSSERLSETFESPDGDPVLNESSKSEEYTGGAGGATAGTLGPDNIAVPGGAGADSGYTSEDTTRNNAIDKVTETTTTPAGRLDRQTVSVALDEDAAANVDPETVSELVAAAAGIDPERGDAVEVAVLPFDRTAAQNAQAALEAAAEEAAAAQRAELIRTGAIVAGFLLVVILVLVARSRSRRRRERRETVDVGSFGPLGLADDHDEGPVALPPGGSDGLLEPAPVPPEILPPTPRFTSLDQRRAEIDALAATDPDKTAEYLRAILADDRAEAQR